MINAGRRVDVVRTCCGLIAAADREDRDGFDALVSGCAGLKYDVVGGLAGMGAITLAFDARERRITTTADRARYYDQLLDGVVRVLGEPPHDE